MEFASIEKFLEFERKHHGGEDKKHLAQEQKNHGDSRELKIQKIREAQARELSIAEQIRDDHQFAQQLQAEADQMQIDPELTEPETEDEDLPEAEDEDDDVQILRRNPRRGGGQRVNYTRFYY